MKKKVLVISDSLGLPRITPENVSFSDTYFFKLKQKYKEYEFFSIMLGGGDLPTLYHQYKGYYSCFNPNIIIVQSGIVDCAPRTFTNFEYKLINSNYFLRKVYDSRLKEAIKRWGRSRGHTRTPKKKFESLVKKMLEINKEAKLYWNAILPASDEYEAYLPNIRNNIEEYNKILLSITGENFIDHSDIPFSAIMSDFHHMNAEGHQILFDKISTIVFDNA